MDKNEIKNDLAVMLRSGRPVVLGILNVTPDSFHDGGRYADRKTAVERARQMAAAGAAVVDVGGESTRPGAEPVSVDEELRRVIPVVEAIASQTSIPVSIDTSKAEVADQALKAGAAMINDITAFRGDQEMAGIVASAGCPVCLMHMLGEPRTMQKNPEYGDVVHDIIEFLTERISYAVVAGVKKESIIIDPGIGFGKMLEHNLEIFRRLDEVLALKVPVMIGASRKSFIGMATGADSTEDRLYGTIATTVFAYLKGARIFRVHDIAANYQALQLIETIQTSY